MSEQPDTSKQKTLEDRLNYIKQNKTKWDVLICWYDETGTKHTELRIRENELLASDAIYESLRWWSYEPIKNRSSKHKLAEISATNRTTQNTKRIHLEEQTLEELHTSKDGLYGQIRTKLSK